MSTFDLRRQAADAMREAGMEPMDVGDVRTDGVLCRFDCIGDKRGKRNAWAVVFATGKRPVVVFGHWARDIRQSVCLGTPGPMDEMELEQARMAVTAAQRRRDADIARHREAAKELAGRTWAQSPEAPAAHPYLQTKRIRPHGLRLSGLKLVVPMRDAEGVLHSLQFIHPNGKKRFLRGGRVMGCFARIGTPGDHFLVCEGFATGASLHEATGLPVAVAFGCGNLQTVAQAMRGKYPDARLTICADNDAKPDGSNPGVDAAREAASAPGVKGYIAIPPVAGDFNDYITGHAGEFTLTGADHAN